MMRRTLFAALALLLPGTAAAQESVVPPRTISVNAQGMIEREPEQGVVLLAVESEATDARAAASANAERMTQLVAALRRAGVADRNIRTTSYELQPEYRRQIEPRNDPPQIAGYRAINMVQVTVDTVTAMGRIIDTAISSGANRVANISFRLRDPHSAHIEAVAIAMRNARREAEAVAEAAGERLGPAQSISTGGYHAPPPTPMYARGMEMDMAQAQTPVETGTLTVVATVNVVYLLAGPR
ncbi:MAG: SIMPL domain-containing protein [Gemmatimonadetes bacterium]|nr:SIMPL domain-containing protein [Gemmatimonadota bacterium]